MNLDRTITLPLREISPEAQRALLLQALVALTDAVAGTDAVTLGAEGRRAHDRAVSAIAAVRGQMGEGAS